MSVVDRPEQPEPFLRGAAFRAAPGVPYPRARNDFRLPRDTWGQARIPAGVRLEFVGDAEAVSIEYRTETDEPGFRGPGGGLSFQLWRGDTLASETQAVLGEGVACLPLGEGSPDERVTVYLPEVMRPTIVSVRAEGGSIEPAPPQPRWVAYGDSILEGWVASAPSLGWAALVARRHGLDLTNMGYAGSARTELPSAEHMASLEADVYSVTHGTNCWAVLPHSTEMMAVDLAAFLDVLRQERPNTPIVVASPVMRPDAEDTPNRMGATLADLRAVMERVVRARIDAGDGHLVLVPGGAMISADLLADDVHPSDEGHTAIAAVLGPVLAGAVR